MEYFVGVDLGQVRDYTAVAVVERFSWERTWAVRYLDRLPLGTPYPEQVRRIQSLMQSSALRGGAQLIIDATGVGRAVLDLFRKAGMGCRVAGITIHGGDATTPDRSINGYRVPQRDLVSNLQLLLQQRRLKIAPTLRFSETLTKELMAFHVHISESTGHDSFGAWRSGEHDDLVFAVGLGAWWGQRFNPLPGGPPEPRPQVGERVKEFFEGLKSTMPGPGPDDFVVADYGASRVRTTPTGADLNPRMVRTSLRFSR